MVQKFSWLGIDIESVDTTIAFYIPPIQQDREKQDAGVGWQWIGDKRYPDPLSQIELDRYPARPFIIGFMRCGTHWISIALECYFQEAIVLEDTPWSDNKRVYPKVLILHNFPEEDYPATNFIVQYRRDPVAVVFSYAYKHVLGAFHPGTEHVHDGTCDLKNPDFFMHRARQYGEWLDQYLFQLEPKDSYTYEDMMQDMPSVLRKICSFLDEVVSWEKIEFDEESCARVIREVTREKCRELLPGRQGYRVAEYEELKKEFYSRYTDRIWEAVTLPGPHIKRILER